MSDSFGMPEVDHRPAYEVIADLRQQLASRDAEIAELVAALKGFVNYPADDADYPPPYKAAHEALAKVRKP